MTRTKSGIITTFVIAGSGATSAAALNLTGSDTLFQFTNDEISACGSPCANLNYVGLGSERGEIDMVRGTQQIAPMDRMLGSAVCATSATVLDAGLNTAEGLVVGLDGILVLGSSAQAGQVACNGNQAAIVVGSPPASPTTPR